MPIKLLIALLIGVHMAAVGAQESEDARVYHAGDDSFVAGERVDWKDDTRGELFAAGESVTVQGAIGGDAVLAGRALSVRGSIADDVYAAGETVLLAGHVYGGVRAAGRAITLAGEGKVDSGISAAGELVTIDGLVEKYAQIAANRVRINGKINGDVVISSSALVLGPNAVVRGNLTYRGPRPPVMEAGARVIGAVRHTIYRGGAPWLGASIVFGLIVWLVGWLIVGALCIAFAPAALLRVSRVAHAWRWQAPLLGLALLLIAPPVIGLLLVSMIGIPLALVLLLAYLLALPLGYLAGVISVSDWIAEGSARPGLTPTRTRRIGLFVLVLLCFAMALAVPVLGWFANLLVLLYGIGAMLLASRRSVVLTERTPRSAAIGEVAQQ
jgi:cytoskeletal protein CcmA (bactofilin family)